MSLTIKNDLSEVTQLLERIELFGKSNNFSDSTLFDISLVMGEIVTNIIMHGYEDTNEHLIALNITLQENYFSAQIIDDGKEFNPLKHTKSYSNVDIEKIAVGGLGIQIITQYVDKIEYERNSDRNILRILKAVELRANVKTI